MVYLPPPRRYTMCPQSSSHGGEKFSCRKALNVSHSGQIEVVPSHYVPCDFLLAVRTPSKLEVVRPSTSPLDYFTSLQTFIALACVGLPLFMMVAGGGPIVAPITSRICVYNEVSLNFATSQVGAHKRFAQTFRVTRAWSTKEQYSVS